MIGKNPLDRRQVLQLGAGAAAGLAITPQAIAQAPKGAPLKKFVIGNTAGIAAGAFTEVMKKKGYLAKYGLEGEFITVSDGAKILSAVISGEVDLVRAAGFGQVLTAAEKGGPVKVVGGAGLLIVQALYSKKPDIKTLKDLEGRTVGSGQPGALLHQMTVALLRKNNVDVDKVTFVNVGSSADVFRAVVAGTIDAGPGQNDVFGEMDKFGVHSVSEFWSSLPEYPYQASFTADKTIAEKRDVLVRGLAAFGELYNYLQSPESRDDYLQGYAVASGGRGDSTAEYQWKFMQQYKPYGLMIPEASVDYLQTLNVEMGIQKVKLPTDKVLDLSMARDAMKMIGT